MPRENRKRGKKHKKVKEELTTTTESPSLHAPRLEPSWIKDLNDDESGAASHSEAPFGFVDQDVKRYLAEVDQKLVEWSEEDLDRQGALAKDDAEDRRLFLSAAMSELKDKELQAVTDPGCSVILERMIHSMDDCLVKRFMTRLVGSFETLARHRYGSHVCQTILGLAPQILRRESIDGADMLKGSSESAENLMPDTLEGLITSVCKELVNNAASLIVDPFASHVFRSVILLLSTNSWEELEVQNLEKNSLRSARSIAYREKQPKMTSIITPEYAAGPRQAPIPSSFHPLARQLYDAIRAQLDDSQLRTLAFDKVASPTLQILIQVESHLLNASVNGSLVNAIVPSSKSPDQTEREYLGRLMRDSTSSHLIEKIITLVGGDKLRNIWNTYLRDDLVSLATHPTANFVIAKAIDRSDTADIQYCLNQSQKIWPDCVRNNRTGIIKAVIDRVAALLTHEELLAQMFCRTFEIEGSKYDSLVRCALCLKPLNEYERLRQRSRDQHEQSHPGMYANRGKSPKDLLAPTIQGALLLQSLLQTRTPCNEIVLQSLETHNIEELTELAQNPISSRVLDVVLSSPTTPARYKRLLTTRFNGHYHILADDRIGSRVAERLWDAADLFSQERIARSLLPHEDFLAASQYGKHFLKRLNLWLLKRRPQEWKTFQDKQRNAARTGETTVMSENTTSRTPSVATSSAPPNPRQKRKRDPSDEIDDLFNNVKTKKGGKDRKSGISME
ncbi:Nucleolar protein 9 [Tulasnella sp. 418]|nr:Nucleolar protein 9 [Tulasnella sp. 418]